MSSGRASRALLVALLAAVGAAFAEPASEERLATLFAELRKAEQDQDRARLRALYGEIASIDPGNAQVQRGLGLTCYLDGDFEAAAAALERAALLQPDLAGVRLYLGISHYRTNRFPEALAELERSPEHRAGDPAAHYWLGSTYRVLGRLPEAISELEQARAKAETNVEVLDLLARAYLDHSSAWFQELLSVDERSPSSRLLRAEEMAMDGVAQAALKELDAALDQAPGLVGLHRLKGQLMWSLGEYEAAAGEYRLELANDPLSAEAHIRLGGFLLDAREPEAALGHLRLARRLVPNDQRVHELLDEAARLGVAGPEPAPIAGGEAPPAEPTLANALAHYRGANASEAAELLEHLVEAQPELTDARRLLVRCYLVEGRPEDASEELQRILASSQDDHEALYLLGRVYEGLAADVADRLFELDPGSSRARLLRGEAFERGPRYEFEKALTEFRAARESDSGNPGVHYAIGRVLFKLKRFDDAILHLEDALSLNQNHGMANYLLGKIRLLQGDRARAIEPLRFAVDARPALADAQIDLARALVLERQIEEGIRIYERLVALDPADGRLRALLAAAYRRAGRIDEAKAEADRARALGQAN